MANPHDLLARDGAEKAAEVAALEQRASPFSALYAHWERNQWSALALDLETDRRSFIALDRSAQDGMVWIFAHRFHAEFSVARLLAPFLLAAPSYDVQLLLATQVSDEHRHPQAVSASTRRSSACAAGSTPYARSPIATWISRPRPSMRGWSTTSGASRRPRTRTSSWAPWSSITCSRKA